MPPEFTVNDVQGCCGERSCGRTRQIFHDFPAFDQDRQYSYRMLHIPNAACACLAGVMSQSHLIAQNDFTGLQVSVAIFRSIVVLPTFIPHHRLLCKQYCHPLRKNRMESIVPGQ